MAAVSLCIVMHALTWKGCLPTDICHIFEFLLAVYQCMCHRTIGGCRGMLQAAGNSQYICSSDHLKMHACVNGKIRDIL